MDWKDKLYVLGLVAFGLGAKLAGVDGEFFALVAALIGLAVGVQLHAKSPSVQTP